MKSLSLPLNSENDVTTKSVDLNANKIILANQTTTDNIYHSIENLTEDSVSCTEVHVSSAKLETDVPNNIFLKEDEDELWEKLDLYSDDETDAEISEELTLWEEIVDWALRNYKNRKSINEMLDILRRHGHPEMPKDVRTLLGTPRISSNIIPCGSGSYLHYGLERALNDMYPNF